MNDILSLHKLLDDIRNNWKKYIQFLVAVLFIVLSVYFLKKQAYEFRQIKEVIVKGKLPWLLVAIGLTIVYILLQGLMYVYSFATVGKKISLSASVLLFLKRNFVSVFLPAGGITSLAFFSQDVEKSGIRKNYIHAASTIYAVIGIVSVIIVAVPLALFSLGTHYVGQREWESLFLIILSIAFLYLLYKVITARGTTYKWLVKKIPSLQNFIEILQSESISKKHLWMTIAASTLIEIVGILQVWFSMLALGASSSLYLSALAYIISVILLIVSPFLRGLGAIELSMVYILQSYGYSGLTALSITLLYRFVEFWLPLLAGALSFLLKVNRLLMRTMPALFLVILGIVNIASVLTPPLVDRLNLVHQLFSLKTIFISNYFVLLAGLFAIITALFLLQGVRTAFFIAIGLCSVSILGNLLKSLDYEEAILATLVMIALLYSRTEYRVRANFHIAHKNLQLLLFSLGFIMLYGIVGMYYLNLRYWHQPYGLGDIINSVCRSLLLLRNHPVWQANNYSKYFFYSLNIWGLLTFCYILFLLIKPKYQNINTNTADLSLAHDMLYRMGDSANDYFKVYFDKTIYFPENTEGFISYKTYKNYAVVLNGPVSKTAADDIKALKSFENFCRQNNMKSFYYRVDDSKINNYTALGKKKVQIGREAILYLKDFNLSGKSKKSLRNSINHAQNNQLKVHIYQPPIKDGLLQKLESVSDNWLSYNDRSELVFSQGIFKWDQLKTEIIFTVENEEGMVIAFLNMLPDFGRKTITYDILRYMDTAPNGTVDFLLIEFFNYAKAKGYESVNLGFVPFAQSDEKESRSFLEKSLELTYNRVKPFATYQQGLLKSKDKFGPVWHSQFLVYDQDFDLIRFPVIFKKITRQD